MLSLGWRSAPVLGRSKARMLGAGRVYRSSEHTRVAAPETGALRIIPHSALRTPHSDDS